MRDPESIWKPATILPGAVLVIVALSQIYLATTGELTPAKGGGFGMFSVVDMRTARTWSIDCLTEDGEPCRVLILRGEPGLGRWLTNRFRTKPDPAERAEAADRVFRARYVRAEYSTALREARVRQAISLLPEGWDDVPLYRLRSDDTEEQPVKLRAIRFQTWRLRFDHESNRVHCEPIGEPEVRGQW